MYPDLAAISARQTFEDNMRPALLMLRVYRLLYSRDKVVTDGEMIDQLRTLLSASAEEDLMLIYNEMFLGLVRERAQLTASTLRHATLSHLLRQAVVASCTALETYLPALLRESLPTLIRARGRDFMPRRDELVSGFFADLHFSIDETLRLAGDENAPEYIANKMINYVNFRYLSSDKGIHITGALLGIPEPARAIAAHLKRDEEGLMKLVRDTVNRRNDIVHRADRSQKKGSRDTQDISYPWTEHAVDTIKHVCETLDVLVAARISELMRMADA